MKPEQAGSNFFAIFAILSLLGFGFVVYAVPGVAPAPFSNGSSTTSSGSQGNLVNYKLVQVAPAAVGSPGSNASGYAGVKADAQSLSLVWYVSKAAPGQELQAVMQVTPTTSTATKSFTFSAVAVSSLGVAEGTGSVSLDPGHYIVGLTVVDPTTNLPKTLFGSDPATAQVVVGPAEPVQPVQSANGGAMSYSLVPLPVYMGKAPPANYSFKEGGALLVAYGNVLTITASLRGSPDTQFYTVVQTDHQNITAGVVTTTTIGGGVYKGNVTLSPGEYRIGLLIYVAGITAYPVAVSIPRAIEITLPYPGAQTSTSTHTYTTTTNSSENDENSTTSYSHTTTTTSTTSVPPPQAATQLQFTPLSSASAPKGYHFGQGMGGYAVAGGSIYFSLGFKGQTPNSHFSVVLTVNGTARTIGNYTTNDDGAGNTGLRSYLGTGKFVLSLSIVDLSNFNAPTIILVSVPSSFTVAAHAESTTTTTSTTTTIHTTTSTGEHEGYWVLKLKPAQVQNPPEHYKFASSGTAALMLDGRNTLNVVIGFRDANPSSTFNAALVLNGTNISLGSMTTNKGGGAELHSSVPVTPGTYLVGIVIYDVSNAAALGSASPVVVMVSDPNTQVAVVVPASGEYHSSSTGSKSSTASQSVVTSTVTTTVKTLTAESDYDSEVKNAVDNLTIPATVQITPLQSSTLVHDSRFSISVGQQVGNGLVIAISGENVTGPRVLLINMSKTYPLALYPSLNVTLDGAPVVEASSAIQVLNPSPTDPARYVLIATADSVQLLVSIPHFSLHLIQVAGQILQQARSLLSLDGPILVGSILVITLAFAGAYASRKRFFSLLI